MRFLTYTYSKRPMKSFSSFREIFSSFPMPERWLPDHKKYLAHLPGGLRSESKIAPETLQEHIELVNQYALDLIEAHGLDKVVDALIRDIIEKYEIDEKVGAYLKEMFASVIHFHDYGKINPNFQTERMHNSYFQVDKSITIGTEHARLSAFLFLHYHFDQIDKGFSRDEEAQSFLWVFAFLLSHAITRHHAPTIEHKINLEKRHLQALNKFLSLLNLKNENGILNRNVLIENWENLFQCFSEEWQKGKTLFFSEAILVKLCFSLLTAADFCATFEYMNQLPLYDWGVISAQDKQQYAQAFREGKSYNKDLYTHLEEFYHLPFEQLAARDSNNLNKLRQKLAAEAIMRLRRHMINRLFYLEAPTGSGKTNISLALALELLQADPHLNKVIYVFPFTTLATQTLHSIRETIALDIHQIAALHSKAGFSEKETKQDGVYGSERKNYIANLFANFPFTLMTHVRFFDILKSDRKEINYLLHRMANSVVIIDELQSYSPMHWDKVIFLLSEYARLFNMRIIMMSATLPHIDQLLPKDSLMRGKVVRLIPQREQFFHNPNFGKRVTFDFKMLTQHSRPKTEDERTQFFELLANKVIEESNTYAAKHDQARTIIEFIKKKTAGSFYRMLRPLAEDHNYELMLISGEILEPQRRRIIQRLKDHSKRDRVILVSTQVVEAGVDIDMDIGFKDVGIPDSEEQLAGRVNRNASKKDNTVFLFDLDEKQHVYGRDHRYKKLMRKTRDQREKLRKQILDNKDFSCLYQEVINDIQKENKDEYMSGTLSDYLACFRRFDFKCIHRKLRLIDQNTLSVFVPLDIPLETLTPLERELLRGFHIQTHSGCVSGRDVWAVYENLVEQNQRQVQDFTQKRMAMKQLSSLLALFSFSFFATHGNHPLATYGEERLGFFYMETWPKVYSLEEGLDLQAVQDDFFL